MPATDRADVRVLSVRQPWATLIVHGIKTIESRSWRTSWRGTLLIHACAALRPGGAGALHELLARLDSDLTTQQWGRALGGGMVNHSADRTLDPTQFLENRGMVVGTVRLTDVLPVAEALCTTRDQTPLADAAGWAWILEDPTVLRVPVRHRGGQGLRKAPAWLLAAVAQI